MRLIRSHHRRTRKAAYHVHSAPVAPWRVRACERNAALRAARPAQANNKPSCQALRKAFARGRLKQRPIPGADPDEPDSPGAARAAHPPCTYGTGTQIPFSSLAPALRRGGRSRTRFFASSRRRRQRRVVRCRPSRRRRSLDGGERRHVVGRELAPAPEVEVLAMTVTLSG